MIEFVTGKIGSGKTLYAVERIFMHLIKGGTVATNIDLKFDKISNLAWKKYGKKIIPAQIVEVDINRTPNWDLEVPWGVPELPVLSVWDEVHLFNNARDWKKTQDKQGQMLSFLTQSRKACVDVIFITQDSKTVDKQFRIQAQFEHYVINSAELSLGPLGSLPKCFSFCIRFKKSMSSRETVGTHMAPYNKSMFGLYDTLSMLDDQMRERQQDARVVEPYTLESKNKLRRLLQV